MTKDVIHQIQSGIGGVVMKKESMSNTFKIRNGRPRVKVDFAILLRLREGDHLGWSRVAQEYRKTTGQFVSRDTLKRGYTKYKELQSAGKLMIDAGWHPLKKKDERRVVVEKIIITPMPNSMKKYGKPTQPGNV